MDEREYSLLEHLAELRKRLGYALLGVAFVSIAGFAVSDQLLEWLRAPMEQLLRETHGATAKFIVIAPAEYIVCQLKAAFVAALFIASPWVLYQIWMFIAPGLYAHEQRYASWFVWAGAACFCGGAAFAYFAVFPTMFRFFVESLPADIAMTPSISDHFSFTLKMLVAFGVVFETPVVTVILSLAGIIDPTKLGRYRKYVVVVAFIIGAVLTPSPDALSQLLLAGPLLLLYEVGVVISRLVVKVKGTPLSRATAASASPAPAVSTTNEPRT
ncbi:MAG: twin arginine-targeting protein translocase TatC [Deltaproteobacteria bacterium RBG_16_71_12]|nr:MAG: twin arginine-targeting protein translocase TatC [Deltaproteobacteria bacterium RBG_16_71_12]